MAAGATVAGAAAAAAAAAAAVVTARRSAVSNRRRRFGLAAVLWARGGLGIGEGECARVLLLLLLLLPSLSRSFPCLAPPRGPLPALLLGGTVAAVLLLSWGAAPHRRPCPQPCPPRSPSTPRTPARALQRGTINWGF